MSLHTQTLLHTATFTRRPFYPHALLHTDAFPALATLKHYGLYGSSPAVKRFEAHWFGFSGSMRAPADRLWNWCGVRNQHRLEPRQRLHTMNNPARRVNFFGCGLFLWSLVFVHVHVEVVEQRPPMHGREGLGKGQSLHEAWGWGQSASMSMRRVSLIVPGVFSSWRLLRTNWP